MPLTTRLAEVEDGLFALLEANAANPTSALYQVAVTRGWPGDRLADEHVWIEEDATTTMQTDVTGPGRVPTVEAGTLKVAVLVTSPGNDYLAARDRAHALAAEVENSVRDDFDMGTPAVFGSNVDAIRRSPAPAELNARGIFIEVEVGFGAYLT